MSIPCLEDSKSFFEKLQNTPGLDLRDRRGLKHDLAVVLTGVTLAILSCRDGLLSSIQRHLASHYVELIDFLELRDQPPQAVSRAQLPRILETVSGKVFEELFFAHFGAEPEPEQRQWLAIDGKELRGSIDPGARRGEAVVRAVGHQTRHCVAQSFYSGDKKSEIPTVRELIETKRLQGRKLSFDALHCQFETLEAVVAGGGKYLVGVKDNQKELLEQIKKVSLEGTCLWRQTTLEKGHGRLEKRCSEYYDLLEVPKNPKWKNCRLRTALKVTRTREDLRTGRESREESYYVTNEVGHYEELSEAVRKHWSIEIDNYLRDVTLKEDALQTKKKGLSRMMAGIRTVGLEILRQTASTNKRAQMEEFADHFGRLLGVLQKLDFL